LPGHFADERHTSTSEVLAVDTATRMITLRDVEGGEPEMFKLGDDVRNLEQVKVGDRVTVDVYRSTSIKALKEGELGEKETATIDRSQPGEKPGGLATRTRTKVEKVSSVFPDSKEFLTRNDKGKLTTWKVKDAEDLKGLKSGDRIQFTSVSELAVSVKAAPRHPADGHPRRRDGEANHSARGSAVGSAFSTCGACGTCGAGGDAVGNTVGEARREAGVVNPATSARPREKRADVQR
jgi:Cu/Ag efflux protein CusF